MKNYESMKKNSRDLNCHPRVGLWSLALRRLVKHDPPCGDGNLALLLLAIFLSLTACTDYEAVVEDNYEEWVASIEEDDDDSFSSAKSNSSSRVIPSNAEESSSSVKDGSEYGAVSNTLKDKRDGQTYKTVKVGDQTWMAENLNYAYNEPTEGLDSSSFCYNNSADSCAKYGRLYLWSAAMDSAAVFSDDGKGCSYDGSCSASGIVRGVCPEGWHLPSKAEWNTLFSAVGGSNTAGTMLMSQTGWYNSGNGKDAYGFSALLAGSRISNGSFLSVGNSAYFWSSSEYDSIYAYYMVLSYGSEYANLSHGSRNYAFSVRCLKD